MVNSLMDGMLAMEGLLAAFLVSYWAMKAFEPNAAAIPITVRRSRLKKSA